MNQIEEWTNSRIDQFSSSGLGACNGLQSLRNLYKTVPMIHVTGTRRKGFDNMRLCANCSDSIAWSWTFTPHIVSIHDRICINGNQFSIRSDSLGSEHLISRDSRPTPLTFEIITLLAFVFPWTKSRPGLDRGWDRRVPWYHQSSQERWHWLISRARLTRRPLEEAAPLLRKKLDLKAGKNCYRPTGWRGRACLHRKGPGTILFSSLWRSIDWVKGAFKMRTIGLTH